MHLLSPKIPLLGIYPLEVIGQVLKNVVMTMCVSTMEKNQMEMNIVILWYMCLIKILKFCKIII